MIKDKTKNQQVASNITALSKKLLTKSLSSLFCETHFADNKGLFGIDVQYFAMQMYLTMCLSV